MATLSGVNQTNKENSLIICRIDISDGIVCYVLQFQGQAVQFLLLQNTSIFTEDYSMTQNSPPSLQLDKVRVETGDEQIENLYKQQKECQRNRKYLEADHLKKQISSIKFKRSRMVRSTVKERQQEEKCQIQNVQEAEVAKFNRTWDNTWREIEKNAMEVEREMLYKHRSQIAHYEKELLHYLESRFKESSELLTLRKTQQGLAKREEYTEAFRTQKLIDEVYRTQRGKYSMEVQRKIKQQLSILKQKQQLQYQSLKQKITQTMHQKKRQYDYQLHKLNRKYINVRAELDFIHSQEKNKIEKDKVLQKSMIVNKSSLTLRR